jgi:hypothetical protein
MEDGSERRIVLYAVNPVEAVRVLGLQLAAGQQDEYVLRAMEQGYEHTVLVRKLLLG